LTLHQVIFHTDEGSLAVIQGTNLEDILHDAYMRYLKMTASDWKYTEEYFRFKLTDGGMVMFNMWLSEDKSMGEDVVFVHYNTWEVTE